jgi:hypothetical protein
MENANITIDTITARIKTVRDHFSSGKTVCTFARVYADKTLYKPANKIGPELLDFAQGNDMVALVYVLAEDGDNHYDMRQQSIDTFKNLRHMLVDGDIKNQAAAIWPYFESDIDKEFSAGGSPVLVFGMNTFFTIALSPHYEEKHPRFAPSSSLVITRYSDLIRVPRTAKNKIRYAALHRSKKRYNADALYVMP